MYVVGISGPEKCSTIRLGLLCDKIGSVGNLGRAGGLDCSVGVACSFTLASWATGLFSLVWYVSACCLESLISVEVWGRGRSSGAIALPIFRVVEDDLDAGLELAVPRSCGRGGEFDGEAFSTSEVFAPSIFSTLDTPCTFLPSLAPLF